MSRKKKQLKGEEEVTLNLASMLDMAFQLLAFFILTFKPAPVEGQLSLRLPPPQPLPGTSAVGHAGIVPKQSPVIGFNTLRINLAADESGKLARIDVDEQQVTIDDRLKILSTELDKDLNIPSSPFDQVVISVPSRLHYSELMRVMGICSKQTLGGDPHSKLSKLSLVDAVKLRSP